jgi:hypothetical protein
MERPRERVRVIALAVVMLLALAAGLAGYVSARPSRAGAVPGLNSLGRLPTV